MPAAIAAAGASAMKATMTAVMLAACMLFVSAMLRMQHADFADRARRALLLATSPAPAPVSPRSAQLAGKSPAVLARGEMAR